MCGGGYEYTNECGEQGWTNLRKTPKFTIIVTRYGKRGISMQKFEIALAAPCESVQCKQYDGANHAFIA